MMPHPRCRSGTSCPHIIAALRARCGRKSLHQPWPLLRRSLSLRQGSATSSHQQDGAIISEQVEADLTWTGKSFEEGVVVEIRSDGKIGRVLRKEDRDGKEVPFPSSWRRLKHRALMPGFVSAHSHAFQIGLRGRGEEYPQGVGSFWTWRESMYKLVEDMTPSKIYQLSRQAFEEMLCAGITSVGEFHYLHHYFNQRGKPSVPRVPCFELDDAVLQAANDSGIRVVLLQTYYKHSGILHPEAPLHSAQTHFESPSIERFWESLDSLNRKIKGVTNEDSIGSSCSSSSSSSSSISSCSARQRSSLGVVGHSVRAVSIPDLVELRRGAMERGLPFHIHLEEQKIEVDEFVKRHGRCVMKNKNKKTPMDMVCEELSPDESFTAVHCTHTNPEQMERFLLSGANVCLCPITEASLGDGIVDVKGLLSHIGGEGRRPGQICIGTDSNVRISMTEEMRWLELVQRLHLERRGVFADAVVERGGERKKNANLSATLINMATKNGAHSLGLPTGEIREGCYADLVTVDLNAPSLRAVMLQAEGAESEDILYKEILAPKIVFGTENGVFREACVGGAWREIGPA